MCVPDRAVDDGALLRRRALTFGRKSQAPPTGADSHYLVDMCKILVVEDEADVREGLCIELASLGHDVVAASDGAEAMRWLGAKQTERPCMVLLDLRMPEMDGWDFIKQLRDDATFAKLPVIVLSAVLKRGSYAPVIAAQAFWQKPPDPALIENIRCYCAEHRDSGLVTRPHQRATHIC